MKFTLFFSFFLSHFVIFSQTNEKLLLALKNGESKTAIKLIQQGADVNYQDENNATILMWAAYKTNIEVVKLLVNKGADYTKKGYIQYGNTGYIGNLTGIATEKDDLEMLKYFIEELKINVDDIEFSKDNNGWTALQWAITKNNLTILKYLLDKGANPNPKYQRWSILNEAIQNDNLEIFNLLLDKGTYFYVTTTPSPLQRACETRKPRFVKALLDKGMNPNFTHRTKNTPLLSASGNGCLECCKLLIENGADVYAIDENGFTPLRISIQYGHNKVRDYLSVFYKK